MAMRAFSLGVLLTGAALPALALGPVRVEVSDDGREIVYLSHTEVDDGVVFVRDNVPFGTSPNWSNTLRRQVGALKAADLNNDGRIDLAVGCYQSSSFPPYTDWENLIYYNTGAALETEPSWVSTDEVSTGDLQVADINGDHYLDIFAANGGSTMSPSVIYFGSATGPSTTPGWTSAVPGRAWNNYALPFDVDHDGDLDVITANQGNSPSDPYRPMFIFFNDGGTLSTTPGWQSVETSIQNYLDAADYDGNGWEDIAVSKWANFESGIYRNMGGALETTPFWTTGATTTDKGVAWADVDGNGWPDLALGKSPTQLFSNDAGTLAMTWTSTAPFFGHSELCFHDVDRDGDKDLVEIHFSDGRAHIYLNRNGVLDRAPSWTYDSTAVGTGVALGDINGDGWDDLALGYSGEPSVIVFYATPAYRIGDVNCDAAVNFDDIDGFITALIGRTAYEGLYPTCRWLAGDIDGNGTVNFDDIDGFVGCLVTGTCP